MLPETKVLYETIKREHPGIKFIFYNFDEHDAINLAFLNYVSYMDYFVIAYEANRKKYEYVLNKKVHVVPLYVNADVLCPKYLRENLIADIVIMVSNNSLVATLHTYIDQITSYCVDHDYRLKLYGNVLLEDLYPAIYENEYDSLSEGMIMMGAKVLIILDTEVAPNKLFSQLLEKACLLHSNVLTNVHNINNFMWARLKNFLIVTQENIVPVLDDMMVNGVNKQKTSGIPVDYSIMACLIFRSTSFLPKRAMNSAINPSKKR